MVINYEEFPMVLVEAMQYGCVTFASFKALSDIMDDIVSGFKVPPFDEMLYAQKVVAFANMVDKDKEIFYKACRAKVNLFSVDGIAKIWCKLFGTYSDK